MAEQVFLHVGTMKSATSYLQSLCQRNRSRLAQAGVLWLPIGSHFASTNALVQRKIPRPVAPKEWRAAVEQIRAHDGAALISNEQLAKQPPYRIRRLLKALRPAEVTVIVTARDLARVIPSHWQTTLRNQSQVPWATYADWICTDNPPSPGIEAAKTFWNRQDLAKIIACWSEQAGRDRVTLVTVPAAGSPPELIGTRFLSVVGVDARSYKPPNLANHSLGLRSSELLRRLNARAVAMDSADYRRAVRKGLVNQALMHAGDSDSRYGLSSEQHTWVRSRAQHMVDQRAALGVTVVGSLDDLVPPPGSPKDRPDPSAVTTEELLDVALDALLRLSASVAKPASPRRSGPTTG
jgi:hypothetical protein